MGEAYNCSFNLFKGRAIVKNLKMMLTFLRRLPNAARPVARRNLSFAISGNLEKLPAAGLKKKATYFHARLQSTLTQDGTDEDANNNRYTQLENYIQGRKREVVQVTETLLKVIASGDYEPHCRLLFPSLLNSYS